VPGSRASLDFNRARLRFDRTGLTFGRGGSTFLRLRLSPNEPSLNFNRGRVGFQLTKPAFRAEQYEVSLRQHDFPPTYRRRRVGSAKSSGHEVECQSLVPCASRTDSVIYEPAVPICLRTQAPQTSTFGIASNDGRPASASIAFAPSLAIFLQSNRTPKKGSPCNTRRRNHAK